LPVEVEAGPFCPLGTLPFSPSDTAWRLDQNEAQSESLARIKHQPADILSNGTVYAYTDVSGASQLGSGNYVVRGVMARTKESQGLTSFPIGGELVSLWGQDDGTWTERGEQVSEPESGAVPGQYEIDLGVSSIEGESRQEYAVLNAERSCGQHSIFELAPGRQVVLTDIDETMTTADEEIFLQIENEDYDQIEKPFSVELTQAWAAKGYQMIYLTARPHIFRAETRAWLNSHGYADGPMITAPELVLGEAARQYKREWVSRLKDDLGWNVVAAYGNAASDIDAYEDGGLDKETTFIIGENAGANGTVAIPDDSFAAHIEDYVNQQPNADGF
jgi:hypothetical protein